jgi:hypothetical protein
MDWAGWHKGVETTGDGNHLLKNCEGTIVRVQTSRVSTRH